MRNYAEQHKLLSQPRSCLIGSLFGKQMLFVTPLLQWYLKKGLIISNITLVMEYEPLACFSDFGARVSDARRGGDVDSNQTIIAETYKLLGNSAYGKTITNIQKHCDVVFLNNKETAKKVNSPLFKKLTPLDEDFNEVTLQKEILRHKLPLQIVFFFCVSVRKTTYASILL